MSTEKAHHYEELSTRVHQLEEQAARVQNSPKELKISLPAKFDGTRSLFRGFLNQVRLVIQLHPNRYPNVKYTKRQVYQVSAHENPASSSTIISNNLSKPNSPCHENRFDVFRHFKDVLNE